LGKQVIDICIPKKEDSTKVTKQQTVVLFESDFNHLNKMISNQLKNHTESANSIAVKQYGSRKKKSAIIHATNKQLTFDIIVAGP
jgi:hypothetical protein